MQRHAKPEVRAAGGEGLAVGQCGFSRVWGIFPSCCLPLVDAAWARGPASWPGNCLGRKGGSAGGGRGDSPAQLAAKSEAEEQD